MLLGHMRLSPTILLLLFPLPALAQTTKPIRIEAEDGQLKGGLQVADVRPGHSGRGYVTNFTRDGDRLELTVAASAGVYDVQIGYCSPGGQKAFELVVNDVKSVGVFRPAALEQFGVQRAGKIALKDGANKIAIEKGWGYYDIDYIQLTPVGVPPSPAKPPKTPSDPDATAKTAALLSRLTELYGQKTLSGQYGEETDYIHQVTGQYPAIFGADLMDYSPSRVQRGAKPIAVDTALARAKEGSVVTLSWHWNAPAGLLDRTVDEAGRKVEQQWWRGFFSEATRFDIAAALAKPDSEDYKLLLRDIDAIAAQLKRLADADVPVLWRPLHEAELKCFWWGAKGPKPLVQLWRLMHDRLTNYHKLHNLIWVFTSNGDLSWYPGDDVVDIVGIDVYPPDRRDSTSQLWDDLQERFDGKKLLAITEFGPVPDLQRMAELGVRWSYFVIWSGWVKPEKISAEELKRLYGQPSMVCRPSP